MSTRADQTRELLRAVTAAIREALTSGAQSASLSVGGATQSVQRYSLEQLRAMRAELLRELALTVGRGRRRVAPTYQ